MTSMTTHNDNNDYKDYNYYSEYRDRDSYLDLDLDWGVVIYNQIVTWTAFAILAMFILTLERMSISHWSRRI